MSEKVKIAVVGVGGIVLWQHLKHLTAIPNVAIAGYLKNQSGRAAETAKQYGGRLYDTVDQIADDDGVDAVVVSVPPFAHGGIEQKLIAAGKALLIEKPLGVDLETVEEISAAASAKGVVTSVGYQLRYQTTVDELRRALVGRPVIGGCGFWCGDQPGVWWWRDKKTSGGQPIEQTTHIFDLANYLIASPPVSVYATGQKLAVYDDPAHTVEDVSCAVVKYANGVAITVWSSDVMGGASRKIGLDLFAVGGRFEIEMNSLTRHDADSVLKTENKGSAYQRLNEAFVHAVATGDRSGIRSDYADALVTHRVTSAVQRSIESGQVEAIGE